MSTDQRSCQTKIWVEVALLEKFWPIAEDFRKLSFVACASSIGVWVIMASCIDFSFLQLA